MNTKEPMTLDRRQFLRGAATLAVTTAIGMETALAASAATTVTPATRTVFWTGGRFVDPAYLAAADTSLLTTGAIVRIHGHSVPGGAANAVLSGICPLFATMINGQLTTAPFHAWVASLQQPTASQFLMPASPLGGLYLAIETNAPQTVTQPLFLTADPARSGPRLQAGTYAIVPGAWNWNGCRLAQNGGQVVITRSTAPNAAPVEFEYVLLTVSAA